MPNIAHRIEIAATPSKIYQALIRREQLAAWWTRQVSGDSQVGQKLEFRFGEGGCDMEVTELSPDGRVAWRCVGGPPEWVGTSVTFDLTPNGPGTYVRFGHCNWKEEVDFMAHCSVKWATFLLSLKALVESGAGRPFPDDVKITLGDH